MPEPEGPNERDALAGADGEVNVVERRTTRLRRARARPSPHCTPRAAVPSRAHASTRPSRISITRSAAPATSAECVTRTTVAAARARAGCAQRVEHDAARCAHRALPWARRRAPAGRAARTRPRSRRAAARRRTAPRRGARSRSRRPNVASASSAASAGDRGRRAAAPARRSRAPTARATGCRSGTRARPRERDSAASSSIVEALQRALADAHLAGRWLVERGREREHGALAAARGSEHGDELATLDAQLEPAQRHGLDRSRAEDLEHVVEAAAPATRAAARRARARATGSRRRRAALI